MKHFSTIAGAALLLSHCLLAQANASGLNDGPAGDTFTARPVAETHLGPASAETGRKALAAFESTLRAWEGGDLWAVRSSLNPSMIGYQRLVDSITTDNNQCKQLRVNLLDTHIQANPDRVLLQTGWEKRCLLLPNFSPALSKGRSTVLLRRSSDGWHIASISGGNMFDRMASDPVAPRVVGLPSAAKPPVTLVAAPAATAVTPRPTSSAADTSTSAPSSCTIRGRAANCALVHYAANCTRTGTTVACP